MPTRAYNIVTVVFVFVAVRPPLSVIALDLGKYTPLQIAVDSMIADFARGGRCIVMNSSKHCSCLTLLHSVMAASAGRTCKSTLQPYLSEAACPLFPWYENMTSSVKPEVHNVWQRRQRRTEPRYRPRALELVKFLARGFELCERTN